MTSRAAMDATRRLRSQKTCDGGGRAPQEQERCDSVSLGERAAAEFESLERAQRQTDGRRHVSRPPPLPLPCARTGNDPHPPPYGRAYATATEFALRALAIISRRVRADADDLLVKVIDDTIRDLLCAETFGEGMASAERCFSARIWDKPRFIQRFSLLFAAFYYLIEII
jgi:hypothetical protein